MKNLQIVLFMLASPLAASAAAAQALDWEAVQALPPLTRIWVTTQQRNNCYFLKATSDKLFCQLPSRASASESSRSDLLFNRDDIREVRKVPIDMSKGFLDMILAGGGGGGLDSNGQPTVVAGGKIGGAFTLDLQYDRIQGHNGFSAGGSAVLPLFRFPGPQENKNKNYIRVYAEPGVGYRAGGGTFGFYSSAQALVLLVSDARWEKPIPYIEFQRRFPFNSPLQGDNRLSIGVMIAFCRACDQGN
jgi:hypothetical protein